MFNTIIMPNQTFINMKNLFALMLFFLLGSQLCLSQEAAYILTIKKDIACTPVKNQSQTSTCWSFSGISFFESELMRMGKKPYDLSEMFVVRETYEDKAEKYARMHGSCTFAGGGEYHDLINITRELGLVPDDVYPGLNYGETKHNHSEMDAALKGYMDGVLKSSKLSTAWLAGVNGILDAYLGKDPDNFLYEGKTYTPASFKNELGINPDDYVIFTSFSHQPFYKQFVLDVPDNWASGTCFNLPLNEFTEVIDNAVTNGYTVAWASDISDKGFSMKQGVAIVPVKNWNEMSEEEASKMFAGPHPQKVITQEIRQKEYDNYATTDDHGMHIVGLAVDQEGNTFYKVKNSWGITGKYDGFIYVSKQFVQLKTTNCMVNKDAIPAAIAKKMGIR
jgi:bleomycin hydrolase